MCSERWLNTFEFYSMLKTRKTIGFARLQEVGRGSLRFQDLVRHTRVGKRYLYREFIVLQTVDVDFVNRQGESVISVLVKESSQIDCKMLVKIKELATFDILNYGAEHRKPLMLALSRKNASLEVIEQMVEMGASAHDTLRYCLRSRLYKQAALLLKAVSKNPTVPVLLAATGADAFVKVIDNKPLPLCLTKHIYSYF